MALTPYKRACFQQALMRKVASAPGLRKVADIDSDALFNLWLITDMVGKYISGKRKKAQSEEEQRALAEEMKQAIAERERQAKAQKRKEYVGWGLGGSAVGGAVGGAIGNHYGDTLLGALVGVPTGAAAGVGAKALYDKYLA